MPPNEREMLPWVVVGGIPCSVSEGERKKGCWIGVGMENSLGPSA